MPKLVILNAGPDTAGCGIALKRAFDNHAPDWEARAICRQIVYLAYPHDIYWPRVGARGRLKREVIRLVKDADVIHVMDLEGALNPFRSWLGGKKIVVHHLGSHFRRNPEEVSANCREYGATEVTDSIDLLAPHVSWLPVPADLDVLWELRSNTKRVMTHTPGRTRIAHAPTHRAIKSSDVIEKVVHRLARRYPIDFDVIEKVSNAECLERKAQSDIFVDQLLLGFGMNAIECWAMGIPVVSGLVGDEARQNALRLWNGTLPWADATERTLEAVIEHLILDEEWRAELGERGRRHADLWHSQASVVAQTLRIYGAAGVEVAA